MKKRLAGFLLAAALTGCGPKHSNFVKVDDVALGSVVVYRNGVAYYERRATVSGGTLTVSVPRDRVDDFLKSLTVVDAISRQPLPVSIPREQANDGAYLVMKLQLPSTAPADVVLTYVTESPAWKPSYRVVVNDDGKKVMLEGWAIVDNTSGEDWKGVRVGVGSSSALSFRYDLWSVRQVQRETLAAEEKFAIAPPTGVSPYGGPAAGNAGEAVLTELGDDEIRRPDGHPDSKTTTRVAVAQPTLAPPPAPTNDEQAYSKKSKLDADDSSDGAETIEVSGTSSGGRYGAAGGAPSPMGGGGGSGHRIRAAKKAAPSKPDARPDVKPAEAMKREISDARVASGDTKMKQLAPKLTGGTHTIVIEGYANANVPDGERRANDRANIVKNQLIDQGVAPARIKVVTKVEPNAAERVRLVAQAPTEAEKQQHGQRGAELDAQPVGESNFFNPLPMTVDKGASAMVAMVHQETEGEVVYLYDAESVRGNDHFAFRAVRFKNPTQSTLETGPVTVYGNKRFIGEGLTEAIPPASSAVVPYALDRQIVVEKSDGEENRIARLVTLQRGILTAEVQHIRRRKLTITNRMNQEAKVFIRHTVNKGWKVVDAPEDFERIGDAHLFQVTLKGNTVRELVISEATPLQRTLDLSADVTLDMMKAYVDAPEATPELRDQLKKLLAIHKSVVDLTEEQVSMRRRLNDYKERMDELHGQIMSLTAVKTGGDLMTHLKSKMKDISDRVQKTTIAIVDQEEKMMLARIQFQDTLAELALNDVTQPGSKPASMSKK